MQEFYLGILTGAVVFGSAGVIGMGMFCACKVRFAEEDRDDAIALKDEALDERDIALTDYATERRKRLEAEQALTDMEAQKDRIHGLLTSLSKDRNAALVKLEQIAAIPNNGKKPNGGLLKAQRIAGAV